MSATRSRPTGYDGLTGRRTPRGLRAKLLAFYGSNPEEELTYADLCTKFGVSYGTAAAAVASMRAVGELESVYVIRRPASPARAFSPAEETA